MGTFTNIVSNWWNHLTAEQQLEIFTNNRHAYPVRDIQSDDVPPVVYKKEYNPDDPPLVPMWDNTTHSNLPTPFYAFPTDE